MRFRLVSYTLYLYEFGEFGDIGPSFVSPLPISVMYMFAQDIDSRLFVEVNFFNLNYCIEFIDIAYIWQRRAFRDAS